MTIQHHFKEATLTANGPLADFLHTSQNPAILSISFELSPSVKDQVESQGIPHTAVRFFNGKMGSLQPGVTTFCDGDAINLFPYHSATNCDSLFLAPHRFIADGHLGKLTNTLRLLGIDTSFDTDWNDSSIIRTIQSGAAHDTDPRPGSAQYGAAQYGYWMRSTDPEKQIRELFDRFDLADHIAPFTRCMKCNGLLNEVALKAVQDKVPPKVQQWHSDYWQCADCGQVYWQGSHFKDLQQKVDKLIGI
ncbi:MAG: Mut7-C RNAse domain-containing protein [Fodinibius sp.]|nr:Mut7-C RNAse domain-containing protein [Fodinibius sp.]